MDIRNELEKFLLTEVVPDHGGDIKSLNPDEDLLGQGIIDSMGIIKVISFLEERFHIKIYDQDINLENFRSLNCIKRMIESKK